MTIFNFSNTAYGQSVDVYAYGPDEAWEKLVKMHVYSRCPVSKLWKQKRRCGECGKPTDKEYCRPRCSKEAAYDVLH